MIEIPVAMLEFVDGGKAIWIHDPNGGTVLRIQCTGNVTANYGCENVCAHADINVVGDIEICIPRPRTAVRTHNQIGGRCELGVGD